MTTSENITATERAQMPSGSNKVLDRRTLERDNKNLIPLITSGMTVLDVGCGSGTITSGIATKAGTTGRVVGIDPSETLIAMAKEKYAGVPNLSFEVANIFTFETETRFDLITSARTLQWLDRPMSSILKMKKLLKKQGILSVLDYNHEKIEWQPAPPSSMLRFYDAFLDWRESAGMDNAIADHLETLFTQAGLQEITVADESEFSHKRDADFQEVASVWTIVAETRGNQLVKDGWITEQERLTAIEEYNHWLGNGATSMKMYLRAVTGHNE